MGHMGVLLMPKAAIDIAPRQQFVMLANVVDFALIEDEDRIRVHQR
jgi:hypothetical protein